MKRKLTSELEDLIEQLASGIQSYPETSQEEIMQIARELDETSVCGQKQQCKDRLVRRLGYDIKKCQFEGSISTISENLLYLTDLAGADNLCKIVTSRSQVLAYDIEHMMKPRIRYLKAIGVKDEDIGKVITKTSSVLEFSIKRMNQRVDYLRSIGVKKESIGKAVTKFPAILVLDVEKTMKPRVEYLWSIGVGKEDIGKIVVRQPQVLASDIENAMKPRIRYLESLGIEKRYIGKVVKRYPSVLETCIEKMDARLDYLKSIGIKEEDIKKIVTKLPQVLGFDIEKNLKPTYKFLQSKFNVGVEDITTNPGLLSLSLEKRIKPRYEFLKSKGLEGKYKASSVLQPSDERFCHRLKCPLEEYQAFKDEYLRRNKIA